MASSFQIDIITPIENINIGTSEYLRAPNLDGLFGVQARHVSSIISIGSGEIKITKIHVSTFLCSRTIYRC